MDSQIPNDPAVIANPTYWLCVAFRSLSDECLENLCGHVEKGMPILCGSRYTIGITRMFHMSAHYDPALLAVRSEMDDVVACDVGVTWDTRAVYQQMSGATGGNYDSALSYATPNEVRRAITMVLQERGLQTWEPDSGKVSRDQNQEEEQQEEEVGKEEAEDQEAKPGGDA